jgi:hypothetical protein
MKKLSRSEMKNVMGGNAPAENCYSQNGSGGINGGSYEFVMANAVGHWCCASCCTATWMQPYLTCL